MTAPEPAELPTVAEVMATLGWLREQEAVRAEGLADSERLRAGMAQVAAMRAANASALMGHRAIPLARQLLAALQQLQPPAVGAELPEQWRTAAWAYVVATADYCPDCGGYADNPHREGCPHAEGGGTMTADPSTQEE